MSAHIAACGRLVADPEPRETRAGKPWATARLAVSLPLPYGADEGDDPPTLWLGATVFGERGAGNPACHCKGDCLPVPGWLELRLWTDREGACRQGRTAIADRVIAPRTGRPGGGGAGDRSSARNGRGDGTRRPAPSDGPMLNDDIPF